MHPYAPCGWSRLGLPINTLRCYFKHLKGSKTSGLHDWAAQSNKMGVLDIASALWGVLDIAFDIGS